MLLALCLSGLAVACSYHLWRTGKTLQIAESELVRQAVELQRLTEDNAGLARFRPIVDVEIYIQKLLADANEQRNAIAVSAAQLKEATDVQVRQATDEARRQRALLLRETEEATSRVRDMTRVLEALTAQIEGYGDRFIIPAQTLIDELAAALEYDDAGKQLKVVREHSRDLVRKGRAADCDYVEDHRRQTAISFIIDAFNGKTDSILADVKEDNAGTLTRRLEDAFHLVNQNGAAFRNARITKDYLDSRILELKWASICVHLKAQEREEQRFLREQIREEERAQREFEKARREAEKEELLVQKTLEKVQRDMAAAGAQERSQYEARLADLQSQLQAAQEKSQRAMSLAQQTKKGHVYIISNIGSFGEHIYKIGMTRRESPEVRVKELSDASVPFDFDIHATVSCDDAPALEHKLHAAFVKDQVNKVNPRKEFFRVDSLERIKAVIENMGISVSWTMVAKAEQFRETIAIERRLHTATTSEKAQWIESQVKQHARQVEQVAE